METPKNPQRLQVEYPPNLSSLNPDWIVGFVDGEGCFHIGISKHSDLKFGYQILPELTVVQHERDLNLLYQIRTFMKCGVVRKNHGDRMCYRVRGLEHLKEIIVPFFETHPLKTKKWVDFLKFRDVILLMSMGEHLKSEGIEKIRSITREMNRGLRKIKSSCTGNSDG